MSTAKRTAFGALGWAVWKAGSKLGWPYAMKKLRDREGTREREAAAAERSAAADERTAAAAERAAEAAERGGGSGR
jgi:hypothetical protein